MSFTNQSRFRATHSKGNTSMNLEAQVLKIQEQAKKMAKEMKEQVKKMVKDIEVLWQKYEALKLKT